MNCRLIRVRIHVKNVRAKILGKECMPSKNRGGERATFTESLLCVGAAPVSSSHGLPRFFLFFVFFNVHFTDGKVEALRARGACQGSPAPG